MISTESVFPFQTKQHTVTYLTDCAEYPGVKRILQVHAEDFKAVTGAQPNITDSLSGCSPYIVIAGTADVSSLISTLADNGLISLAPLKGKREVYSMTVVPEPFPGIKSALVIAGSDKRGTIYGIFKLSELFGVSPWTWWADVPPVLREELILPVSALNLVSKEPSVRYRGFFINDEWPSFGSWTMEHFGGFNAKMYDRLFQLLLRLKGNYLWPAMWSASFSLDGPGLENAELADMYGVVMGASHHEPCCRASEEWDKVRGEDSIYGNDWNYYTNREGLLRYWEGGLQRNKNFESLITIGMRGERDTSMLGEDSTLRQNIDLLKDIITEQNRLIRKHVNKDLNQVPRLLALYKEVEAYYYGDEATEGLIHFEGLDGVTIMLCEDNYGNMRTLPPKALRDRKGGWGMYYHFDYHGGPISYEWVNSTPLAKTWEQMSMAYDYGIRDVWIVNVGDLKPQELPLSFFMDLAYDFESYGTAAPNTTQSYTMNWVKQQFPFTGANSALQKNICAVLEEYTRINGMRRPEAMNPSVYSASLGNEAALMLERTGRVISLAQECKAQIPPAYADAFYQLVYFPAVASMNVQRMSLLSALNKRYFDEQRTEANLLADETDACIALDTELTAYYNETLSGGKWKGMMSSAHICFDSWNDERWSYPGALRLTPQSGAKLQVFSVAPASYPKPVSDREIIPFVLTRPAGSGLPYTVLPGSEQRSLDISNAGSEAFDFCITSDAPWLTFSQTYGTVITQTTVSMQADPGLLPASITEEVSCDLLRELSATVTVTGAGDTVTLPVRLHLTEVPDFPVTLQLYNEQEFPVKVHILTDGCTSIHASEFSSRYTATDGATWQILKNYGYAKDSVKVYPTTVNYSDTEDTPYLEYNILATEDADYTLSFRVAPSNHLTSKVCLRFALSLNGSAPVVTDTLPQDFLAGAHYNPQWCQNVLDNYRKITIDTKLNAGLNRIRVYAMDAGLVLQEVIVAKKG